MTEERVAVTPRQVKISSRTRLISPFTPRAGKRLHVVHVSRKKTPSKPVWAVKTKSEKFSSIVRIRGGVPEPHALRVDATGKKVEQVDGTKRSWDFDRVIGPDGSGEQVWDHLLPFVNRVIHDQVNLCVTAIGGSGSGKSYTLDEVIPMIFHHLRNVANLWAKLEIKVTEYIANRPAFDLLPATKVLGVRDPVELYRRTTGKRQTSTTEANQTSSRSIVELKITIGQAMLRIFDLPGKEFAGRPDSAWINPSYETLSSFLRLMRKLPSVSFAKEIKPRARKAGLEIELALLWRQVKKSRGLNELVDQLCQGALSIGIACVNPTMERAQKVRNIATIEMGQGYASVQVKVTGRGHVVPFDSGKHVGPSKVEDMDEFLLWKAENRNLKDQLREAQEKLERLTGDGPDIHGKQSEADDWEDEDDPVGAVKPYASRKKDDPAASPWNMPAGSPIQMIGDTSPPFELENTTFSPKHLPRPNSSKLVPDPAVGPMMDVEPGLISAVFDDLLPKDLVARLASSSASSSTDIQGAIVECRELIKSWKEKGEASDKQRVILSDKWEAYVEDTESERRA